MFGPEYPKIQTAFKRDERRIIIPGAWTLPEFEYLIDCPWRWTEKVDGTNIRVHWDGEKVAIGGRTDSAQVPTFLLAKLHELYDPERWKTIFPDADDVTLYGEGYGPKIQKGGQYRDDPALILFDVRYGQWWLEAHNVAEIAGKFGLEMVPVQDFAPLREAVRGVEEGAFASRWPNARIEGIVGQPTVPLFDRRGNRIMVKLKVKDFEELRRR